jgi:hypothetical protein
MPLYNSPSLLSSLHNEWKTLDLSILSTEQFVYISSAPDIAKIVEETENCVRKAKFVKAKATEVGQKTEENVLRLQSVVEEKAMNLMNQLIFD